jgi:hypothetical protein
MSATSQARVDANRQNAQSSTGPRTEAGKQKSALNSVRHGLTGQTIILPADQVEAYQNFTEGYLKELAPVGVYETDLVHSIMNCRWRMHQIAAMESAIYALGFREHGAQFADETPEMAAAMARAITYQHKRQDLERLRRYESQLNRQANKDQQLLTTLQTERKEKAAQQEKDAIALLTHFTTTGKPWNPADFGFFRKHSLRSFISNDLQGSIRSADFAADRTVFISGDERPAHASFVLSIEEIRQREERQFLLNRLRGGS